ncbi:MAG: hypothetical protein ACI9Y7_000580 [Dokdonia sp.]|jgi:hypothetical protein
MIYMSCLQYEKTNVYIHFNRNCFNRRNLFLVSCNNKTKKETTEKNQQMEKIVDQNPYTDMRKMALTVTAEQLGFQIPKDSIKVYGIISDLNMGGVTATVVTYLTGDASIYLFKFWWRVYWSWTTQECSKSNQRICRKRTFDFFQRRTI